MIEQIIGLLGDRYHYYFYRTQDGTEADLVVVDGDKPLYSIEVKMNNAPKLTKGMINCLEDLQPQQHCVIVPACKESYPIPTLSEEMALFLRKSSCYIFYQLYYFFRFFYYV